MAGGIFLPPNLSLVLSLYVAFKTFIDCNVYFLSNVLDLVLLVPLNPDATFAFLYYPRPDSKPAMMRKLKDGIRTFSKKKKKKSNYWEEPGF